MLGMQDLGDVGCSVDPCRMDWPMLSNDSLLDVHHLYGAKHLGAALQRAQETAASAEGSWLHTNFANGLLHTLPLWTRKAAKLQVTVCSFPVQDTGPETHSSQQQGTHITYGKVLHNQQLPDICLVHQQV